MANDNKLVNLADLKEAFDNLNQNKKTVQTAVSDPTASGNDVSFIASISQDTQGVIAATKKTIAEATTTAAGLMSATDKTKLDEAAPYNVIGPQSVVSVSDAVAAKAGKVVVNIEPVQSGNGDPSPTNVRPISGWTGANVTRTGKNTLDIANASTAKPSWYPGGWSGTTKNSKAGITQDKGFIPGGAGGFSTTLKPGATYTVSWTYDKALASTCRLYCGSYNGTGLDILVYNVYVVSDTNRFSYTFTVPSDSLEIAIRPTVNAEVPSGQTYDIDYIQIELGSTATAYEPFSGTTIPISWQSEAGTVYGGTLDVTTGLLTVNKILTAYDGTENWQQYPASTSFFLNDAVTIQPFNQYQGSNNISNYGYWPKSTSEDETPDCVRFQGASNRRLYIINSTVFSDVASLKSALSQNNLQICYKIAEPFNYQLTPIEMEMLLGDNNMWADTGDITVGYLREDSLSISQAICASIDGIPVATENRNGLMSAADKTKLNSAVTSVNGETGAVVLDAEDVGALPSDTVLVNRIKGGAEAEYRTGDVTITASNIGAVAIADIPTSSYSVPDSFDSGVTASEYADNTIRCIQYGNGLKRITGIFNVTSDHTNGHLFTVPSNFSFVPANNGGLQQGWGFMGRRGSYNNYAFRLVGRYFNADDALAAGTYVVDYLYF